MDTSKIKEDLLFLVPHWNYHITKPLKQLLDNEVNMEMYYCLQALRHSGAMTMTEFSNYIHIPPHKMSKISNRLHEQGFIEREYDKKDRRVIRIKVTEKAVAYLEKFYKENTNYFESFLGKMNPSECEQFADAVHTLLTLFFNIQDD